jgi:hypothetical protein
MISEKIMEFRRNPKRVASGLSLLVFSALYGQAIGSNTDYFPDYIQKYVAGVYKNLPGFIKGFALTNHFELRKNGCLEEKDQRGKK